MTLQGPQLRRVSICASDPMLLPRQTAANARFRPPTAVVGPGARARMTANDGSDPLPFAFALSTVRRRSLAWVVDFLFSLPFTTLLVIVAVVLILSFDSNALSSPSPSNSPTAAASDSPFEYGFVWVGWLVFLALSEAVFGTTLGKMVLDLRVVDRSGQTVRFWRRLVRILCLSVEIYPPIALILAKVTPNRQRLGDIVADTYVVRGSRLPRVGYRSSELGMTVRAA
jgi:uncharacterized RDD family membrane protein YckC